jgi:hypothetical protein
MRCGWLSSPFAGGTRRRPLPLMFQRGSGARIVRGIDLLVCQALARRQDQTATAFRQALSRLKPAAS